MNGAISLCLVAAGGALGSVARYSVSAVVLGRTDDWRFPVGTFTVNVVGCLIIGVLGAFAVKQHVFSPEMRLLLFTGLMGGFTTFSTFGLETFYLLRRGEVFVAGGYIIASVVAGLLVAWLGFSLVSGKG